MNITIDGKKIEVSQKDKNIVDIAHEAGIAIPAPCYRADRAKGCCKGCVVEINGRKEYACATKPDEGMEIIVNREDLKAIRKERLKEYSMNQKQGCDCGCDCEPASTGGCC